jgi:hypothetical protein
MLVTGNALDERAVPLAGVAFSALPEILSYG